MMVKILSFFYSDPALAWGAVLLVLVLGYRSFAPRLKINLPGTGLSTQGLVNKLLGPRYHEAQALRTVKRLKKQGHFLGAGKLYEDIGKLPEAAEAYQEGHEFFAAATVYERMGKGERAAELYLQAGDHKKAAQVLIDAGKPGKAATLFLDKGNTLEAARSLRPARM